MAISVSEIYLEQQKTEKFWLDFEDEERKGWTIFETTDNPDAELVMNKQSTLERDQKGRRSRVKLHDLPAKKNLKGGSSAKLTASANGSSGIPTSLQEFLERDSLPIKSD